MGIAAASMGAMLYVGLYQSRAVRHIWCPVFSKGCEAVADAAFAKPFGIPDGYIAAVLYAVIFLLLMGTDSQAVDMGAAAGACLLPLRSPTSSAFVTW